jgi:hypothetical protein
MPNDRARVLPVPDHANQPAVPARVLPAPIAHALYEAGSG